MGLTDGWYLSNERGPYTVSILNGRYIRNNNPFLLNVFKIDGLVVEAIAHEYPRFTPLSKELMEWE